MSILGGLIPIARTLNHSICNTLYPKAHFNFLAQKAINSTIPGGIFNLWSRNLIICHFPRPSEVKRIKRHGYRKRMSTVEGRRIIMRRILKGRHVYSH